MKNEVLEKKKINGFLKFLISIILIIVTGLVLLKIFLPDFFGPRDLGIEITDKSYNTSLEKLKIEKIEEIKSGSYSDYIYTYGKTNKVDDIFNSEEITSFINHKEADWYDIKNVQVKILENGFIEMSFSANIDAVLKATDFIPERYKNKDNIPVDFIIPDISNIYLLVSGSIVNNKVQNLNIIKAEVMSVDVNDYIVGYNAVSLIAGELNDQLNYLTELTGFYVESANFKEGNMHFKGLIPSYIINKKK